ncbi:MAG: hypothetical protein ACRDZ8_06430 [Acidimicrobiales bacterium]
MVGPTAAGSLPALGSPVNGTGPWQPAGDPTDSGYSIYVAEVTVGGGVPPAVVAWMNAETTHVVLYAGTNEPPGPWTEKSAVPPDQQQDLLAAFNSGFMIADYHTGWYDDGMTAMPLQPGAASLVINADGTVNVGQWGRDVGPGPGVQAVRQNLPLLVDNSTPVPSASVPSAWGATLGGVAATWRSGAGITAGGDLVYVGGPSLTPLALAQILVAAGSLRAMELDINPEWVSFATFAHVGDAVPGPITQGNNVLSGMNFAPSHYLQPFSRDFFAVFPR